MVFDVDHNIVVVVIFFHVVVDFVNIDICNIMSPCGGEDMSLSVGSGGTVHYESNGEPEGARHQQQRV